MIDITNELERTKKEDLTMNRMRRRKDLTKSGSNLKGNPITKDNLIAFQVDFKAHLQNQDMLS